MEIKNFFNQSINQSFDPDMLFKSPLRGATTNRHQPLSGVVPLCHSHKSLLREEGVGDLITAFILHI
jgi:hypothetical protein